MSTSPTRTPTYASFPNLGDGTAKDDGAGSSRPSPSPSTSSSVVIEDRRTKASKKPGEDVRTRRPHKRARNDQGRSPRPSSDRHVPLTKTKAQFGQLQRAPGTETPMTGIATDSNVFFDATGSSDNLAYGRAAADTQARYRRSEWGRLLGLSERYRAVTTGDKTEKGLEVADRGLPYASRYSSGSRRHLFDTHWRFQAIGPASDGDASFLSFESPELERSLDMSRSHGASFEIEEDVFDETRRRINKFEDHLARHPLDVDVWLSYAHDHHEDQPTRAQLEVTCAILHRALERIDGVCGVPLHIDLLHVGETLWAPDRVEKKWHEVLDLMTHWTRLEGASGELLSKIWQEYLCWAECLVLESSRTIDDVIASHKDIMRRLPSLIYHDDGTREEHLCYVFARLCLFVCRAGFEERAIAMIQAQCEFTFFRPASYQVSDSKGMRATLDALEDFWDSGYPRCGEPGAKGWEHARPADVLHSVRPANTQPVGCDSDDLYVQWAAKERYTEPPQRRPARTDDIDIDDEDPYRCVLFDEIRPFIFLIESDSGRKSLMFAVFQVLDVHIGEIGRSSSSLLHHGLSGRVDGDFLQPNTARCASTSVWQIVGGQPVDPIRSTPAISFADQPVRRWAVDVDSLFTEDWFRVITKTHVRTVDHELLRNIISLVRTRYKQSVLDISYLAFEAAFSIKQALKVNKYMLAEDRANADLWTAYARLERRRGKIESARTIYATFLADTSSDTAEDSHLRMWSEWAFMEWERGEVERCLAILLAFADGRSTSGLQQVKMPIAAPAVSILKAQKAYALSQFPVSHGLLVLACLWRYREGIEAVRQLCQQQYDACGHPTYQHELARQLLTRMIHLHVKRHPTPAFVARTAVQAAIDVFPANTQFHTLFLENELRAGLRSRIYEHAMMRVKSTSSTTEMIWAAWAMAAISDDIYNPDSGGYSRVRSLLDKALSHRNGRRAAVLWALAIHFEAQSGQLRRARELCYRALAAVGGVKELYLIPFCSTVRPAFTEAELQQIVDRLVGRGLRLRVPTATVWPPMGVREGLTEGLPEDESLAEDELDFLRERQALRPY